MNFQNIEYFLKVVEYKNFSRAAQSLFISQQSLSENIKRLEDEIGTPLLVRGKTVTLTPAGEILASGGRKILKIQDKVLREISIITDTARYKVVIGVPSCGMPPFLPLAFSIFSKRFSEYELELTSDYSQEMPDITISYTEAPKNYEKIPLISADPFAVVFSRILAYQIYGNDWNETEQNLREGHNLSSISRLPFLLFYQDRHLDPLSQKVFKNAGFTPRDSMKSEDLELLVSMCLNGSGAFIGPYDYCSRKFGALIDPVSGSLMCTRLNSPVQVDLFAAYSKNKHLNPAEKQFLSVLKEVI